MYRNLTIYKTLIRKSRSCGTLLPYSNHCELLGVYPLMNLFMCACMHMRALMCANVHTHIDTHSFPPMGLYHTWQFAFLSWTHPHPPNTSTSHSSSVCTPQLGSHDNTLMCVLQYFLLYLGDVRMGSYDTLFCSIPLRTQRYLRKILQVIFDECSVM